MKRVHERGKSSNVIELNERKLETTQRSGGVGGGEHVSMFAVWSSSAPMIITPH